MKRRADWEPRLHKLVAAAETRAHRYGSHDCTLWAANVVRAVTGTDFARGMRERYRSGASASRFLRGLGFATPLELADAKLGARVPVLLARRGDVVSDGEALGLMWAGHALFVGEEGARRGLVRVPLADLNAAWRVGE